MYTIYLDGQLLKVNTQILDAFTPGVFRAKGVFETMLGLDGQAMDVSLHMRRLRGGLKVLGIKPPGISPLLFKKVLLINQLSCARLRLMVWQSGKQIHVMAMALPYTLAKKKNYRVCLIRTKRAPDDRWAQVKSLDYGLFADAFRQAHDKGFDEALLLNSRGDIFEASRANIFWVKNRILYTPPLSSGCLNGITRQQVIKEARYLQIPVKEMKLKPKILKNADAAFLTNSLIGIKAIEVTFS